MHQGVIPAPGIRVAVEVDEIVGAQRPPPRPSAVDACLGWTVRLVSHRHANSQPGQAHENQSASIEMDRSAHATHLATTGERKNAFNLVSARPLSRRLEDKRGICLVSQRATSWSENSARSRVEEENRRAPPGAPSAPCQADCRLGKCVGKTDEMPAANACYARGTSKSFALPWRRFTRVPPLRSELRAASAELALQALHDRAMHLAHAAFGEIERGADLFHRQLFVVVEDDDQPLVAV